MTCLLPHSHVQISSKLLDIVGNQTEVGLKIKTDNTKSMRANVRTDSLFNIGQEVIEDVNKFVYLGSVVRKMEEILIINSMILLRR